jgi:hypothetical protein
LIIFSIYYLKGGRRQKAGEAAHRGRFLILSVEAGPGRQGGIVDKEDFIQKMYFGFAQYKVCSASVFVTLSALSSKSCPHDNVKYLPL